MISLSTMEWLIWAWIVIAVVTFVALQFVVAPYGRHSRSDWGPTISNRLGWLIMESPGLVLMPTFFALGPTAKTWMHWLMLCLYLAHYVHRSLIFPWRTHTAGKRMPAMIMGSAIFFNLVNTSTMGIWLGWFASWPEGWELSWQFLLGTALFALGVYMNVDSDNRLLSLRKPGETGYKIPQGGFFRWWSCPNLVGEVIEWIGYALMGWNIAVLSFAIWTFANLVPRAAAHHKWYLGKFADYPRRWVLLVGLW